MVCVGIDVAKDKHDCCILDSDGMVRADCFTISNNMDGFKQLLQTIRNCTKKSDKIKVGLEATGHYSYNILGFLLDNGLPTYVINPLHTMVEFLAHVVDGLCGLEINRIVHRRYLQIFANKKDPIGSCVTGQRSLRRCCFFCHASRSWMIFSSICLGV